MSAFDRLRRLRPVRVAPEAGPDAAAEAVAELIRSGGLDRPGSSIHIGVRRPTGPSALVNPPEETR